VLGLPLLGWSANPAGAATGTIKDITAKEVGKPLLAEVAEAVGHNKISINLVLTLITGKRVSPETEPGGLDIPEVGVPAYSDFAIVKGKREEAANGSRG